MAEFGADFEPDAFRAAHVSEDPVELNRVKAVERGVDQLYNYIAELAAFGLELAELRGRRDETDARRDLDALRDAGAGLEDRLDPLADRGEVRTVAELILALGAHDRGIQGGKVFFELSAAEVLITARGRAVREFRQTG